MDKKVKALEARGYTVKIDVGDNGMHYYEVRKGKKNYGGIEVSEGEMYDFYNEYGSFEGYLENPTVDKIEEQLKAIYRAYN